MAFGIKLNPITVKQLNRFRHIKRGYYSFLALVGFLLISFLGPVLVGNRALVVSYQGELSFPVLSGQHAGTEYGFDYAYDTNYRDLQARFKEEDKGDWLIMPPVPFNAYENDAVDGVFKPDAPNASKQHYFGTDTTGRDIFARLFYGTRIALLFALAFLVATYGIGVAIGCAMGYFGGLFDLVFQRLIEIWSNIPFLYMVIIVFSVIPSTFSTTISRIFHFIGRLGSLFLDRNDLLHAHRYLQRKRA